MRMNGGQVSQVDAGVELEPLVSYAHINRRRMRCLRVWRGVAISAESVNPPFARRRKVELVVCSLPFYRDEGLETGMSPQLRNALRLARRCYANTRNVRLKTEAQVELSTRPANTNMDSANAVRRCHLMATEVQHGLDVHLRPPNPEAIICS